MYIQSRSASACYKLFIGLLACLGFWISLASFGMSAWRLFSTYVLCVAMVYYLLSALMIALSRRRPLGKTLYPSLDGGLMVSFALIMVATVNYRLQDLYLPGAGGWHAALIYFMLPFLVLMDWLLFARKGTWQPIDPLYWLAGPTMYCAGMILTAEYLSPYTEWLYPLGFMNYAEVGILEMVEWLITLASLILIGGYILLLVDFVMSGKLGKYVVLPRIKMIPIDEEIPEAIVPPSQDKTKTAQKDQKIDGKAPSSQPEAATVRPVAGTTSVSDANKPKPSSPDPKSTSQATSRPKPAPSKPKTEKSKTVQKSSNRTPESRTKSPDQTSEQKELKTSTSKPSAPKPPTSKASKKPRPSESRPKIRKF